MTHILKTHRNQSHRDTLLKAAIVIGDLALRLKECNEGDADADAEYKRLWALRDELLKLRGEE